MWPSIKTAILLCCLLFVMPSVAQACVTVGAPIEAETLSDVFNGDRELLTVEVICDEKCKEFPLGERALRDVESGRTFSVEGYLGSSVGVNFENYLNFFDPWTHWGQAKDSCKLVPLFSMEFLYDIAVENDRVVWAGPHKPYFATRALTNSTRPKLDVAYATDLALQTIASADEFWYCDPASKGAILLADANFKPTDIVLNDNPVATPTQCKRAPTRGITLKDKNGQIVASWFFDADHLYGTKISGVEFHERFAETMLETLWSIVSD